MKPLDLSPIKKFVEAEMTDTCSITVDSSGTADDTYDENTAVYTEVGRTTLYTGVCFLSTQGWQPADSLQGGGETVESSFKLVLPLAAVIIPLRAEITLMSSMRNENLVGQKFIVQDRIDSSHSVSQNVLVRRIVEQAPL